MCRGRSEPLEDAGESGDEQAQQQPARNRVRRRPPIDVGEGDEVVSYAETGARDEDVGRIEPGMEVDVATGPRRGDDVAALLRPVEPPPAEGVERGDREQDAPGLVAVT